jgi:hypothetical protein
VLQHSSQKRIGRATTDLDLRQIVRLRGRHTTDIGNVEIKGWGSCRGSCSRPRWQPWPWRHR